jgi:SAM-dependent methyltransferase
MQRRRRAGARDRELEAGSRAHYDDPAYYAATYRRRMADVMYYVELAVASGGPVLEYGVGNGRIALPLARAGIDVVGVDHSKPMLDDLRARLRAEPADVRKHVKLVHGDMRDVRLRRRFPLVLCAFNTALHLYVRDDVERFLAGVHAHLTPRGVFVADLSTPPLADLERDPDRAYHAPRFRHPTTGVMVKNIERFDYDPARQVLFVSMEFEPVGHPEKAWMTPLCHRQFFPQEWEALLHYNELEAIKVEGDFHGGPLDKQSDVMVWHARRRAAHARRTASRGKAGG